MSKECHCRRSMRTRERESPGCMSGLLQLFDFHYFNFTTSPQPTCIADAETITKGVEAPRNSLELLEGQFKRAEEGKEEEEEEEDDIPMGILLVPESLKAEVSKSGTKEPTLEISGSNSFNGAKTPNVVARLMGLDLLPDYPLSSSPSNRRNSLLKCKSNQFGSLDRDFRKPLQTTNMNLMEKNNQMGTRSLPETPRISSARRSDVDPRLSLQLINKENMAMDEPHYSSSSPLSSLLLSAKARKKEWRDPEENKSPRTHYARELVKQVKERVGRKKVGFDIPNPIEDEKFRRRSEICDGWSQTKQSTCSSSSSCSPRIRFKQPKSQSMIEICPRESGTPKSKTSNMMIKQQRPNCNRFTERIKKPLPSPSENSRSIREEGFVCHLSAAKTSLPDKKFKTPLSKDLLNIVVPPSNPVKKKPSSSITKQTTRHVSIITPTNLSTTSSQPYDQTDPLVDGEDRTATTSTRNRYIKEFLKHSDIESNTAPSVSHHSTKFETLETSTVHVSNADDPLAHRCNGKLTFHLIEEILRHVLEPYPKPLARVTGDELLRRVCVQMRSVPGSKCETLEDIDALVEKDMRVEANVRCLEGDIGSMVFEIERGMIESLIDEVLLVLEEVHFAGLTRVRP